jgi:uncharacterized protein YjbI with pentapeptide repeats
VGCPQSYQDASRETVWFSHRDSFVKRRLVLFGCACASIGIDPTATAWMAAAASAKPPDAARLQGASLQSAQLNGANFGLASLVDVEYGAPT